MKTPHTCFLRRYEALKHILGDVEFLAQRWSLSTAKRFGEFRMMLEQHLRDEEEVLLPRFSQSGPGARAVLDAIHDHRLRLLKSVDDVASTIACSEHAAFCAAMNSLDEALEAHRADEEHVVHPALENVLRNDSDWELLCAQVHFANAQNGTGADRIRLQ